MVIYKHFMITFCELYSNAAVCVFQLVFMSSSFYLLSLFCQSSQSKRRFPKRCFMTVLKCLQHIYLNDTNCPHEAAVDQQLSLKLPISSMVGVRQEWKDLTAAMFLMTYFIFILALSQSGVCNLYSKITLLYFTKFYLPRLDLVRFNKRIWLQSFQKKQITRYLNIASASCLQLKHKQLQ